MKNRAFCFAPVVFFMSLFLFAQHALADNTELRKSLDTYIDGRWLPKDEADAATDEIIGKIKEAGCSIEEVEGLIREGRTEYEKAKGKVLGLKLKGKNGKEQELKLPLIDLQCEHVDYKTSFFLIVPKSYDPRKPTPLLVIGHGGNSAMSKDYAMKASLSGTLPWLGEAQKHGMIIVAPLTERGWGAIGNSILMSSISWAKKHLNIDPDRIYLTGHSMGGHMSHRAAIFLPDRWAAVSPMSGGYDYVNEKHPKMSRCMFDVPGYATYGKKEPYDINKFNHIIDDWMKKNNFDWINVEKPGGHQIFFDELPKIADFMMAHPRNLYRDRVYAAGAGDMQYRVADKNPVFGNSKEPRWDREHHWNTDRPISRSVFHWLRLCPNDLKDDDGNAVLQRVWAKYEGDNHFDLTTEYVRKLRIFLHPKMIDFSKPVVVTANGKTVFDSKVEPDMKTMLELVREFDDRGRIAYAAIDVDIDTDTHDFPEPQGAGVKQ